MFKRSVPPRADPVCKEERHPAPLRALGMPVKITSGYAIYRQLAFQRNCEKIVGIFLLLICIADATATDIWRRAPSVSRNLPLKFRLPPRENTI